MNKFLAILLLSLVAAVASAETEQPQAYLSVRSISPCSFWTYNSAPGSSGYLCSSYSSVNVADGYQTQNAMDALEERIRVLEEKVKTAESKK